VDVAGDTTLVPAALTIPIYWSILTWSAPITLHDRVDVLSELRLLLNMITGGVLSGCVPAGCVPGGGVVADDGV
jgi:hypothetical protein